MVANFALTLQRTELKLAPGRKCLDPARRLALSADFEIP
jgi:hypothetical protein